VSGYFGGDGLGQDALSTGVEEVAVTLKSILFLHERRGNVYENKGQLPKTWDRSGNPIDNKGHSRLKPECC
jgi:hypothetical protein